MPQWMGQTISCSDVGRSCMGNARGHGYPSACWDLQRSVWLSYIRVRDRDVPGGLRSCRWNLCIVHFGRNYFLGHWQQEVLKSTGKYYWKEFSGKKIFRIIYNIKFYIYVSWYIPSQASPNIHCLWQMKTGKGFSWLNLSVYCRVNRAELLSPVLTRKLAMWELFHGKKMKLMGKSFMLPPCLSIW